MVFGIREKKTVLGSLTSDRCEACGRGREYRLEKTVKYIVVLSVSLIPLRVRYGSVCEGCGAAEKVENRVARGIARKHFRRAQLAQQFFMALRLLIAAAVILAAVILPAAIRIPLSRDPETLKSLVSADGDYLIKDRDGELLAIVQVEGGVKTLLWYDKVSELVGTGSTNGRFYLHENYQEATDGSGNTVLVRNIDAPGRLLDQYNTVVRMYYYDSENDVLGFYNGVEDLSAITYTARKVMYPSVYYLDGGESRQYMMVLYLLPAAQVRAQFTQSLAGSAYDTLVAVDIDSVSGSRVTEQAYYYLDEVAMSFAAQAGISPDSDGQAIVDFLTVNGVSATQIYRYDYYGGTGVAVSEQQTLPDATGEMQTQTTFYDVAYKNGYYILQYVEPGENDAQG